MAEDLKQGDRVSFDAPGSKKSPYGFGVVTRVTGGKEGATLIQPDGELPPGFRMTNIKKVN